MCFWRCSLWSSVARWINRLSSIRSVVRIQDPPIILSVRWQFVVARFTITPGLRKLHVTLSQSKFKGHGGQFHLYPCIGPLWLWGLILPLNPCLKHVFVLFCFVFWKTEAWDRCSEMLSVCPNRRNVDEILLRYVFICFRTWNAVAFYFRDLL